MDDRLRANSLNDYAYQMIARGDYGEAINAAEQACTIYKPAVGADIYSVSYMVTAAEAYRLAQRYAEAQQRAEQALAMARSVEPRPGRTVAVAAGILGMIYRAKGDYKSAEPLYREASEIHRVVSGEDSVDFAASMNNLGLFYQQAGRLLDAEAPLKWALNYAASNFGPNDPRVATASNNLGLLYKAMGRFGDAESFYRRALAARQASLGLHPEVANAAENLSQVYVEMRDVGAAEALIEYAMDVLTKTVGQSNGAYGHALVRRAAVTESAGDLASAEALLRQGLEILRHAEGDRSEGVALAWSDLSSLNLRLGRLSAAMEYAQHAASGYAASVGTSHPSYGMALESKAQIHLEMGRYDDALKGIREALSIIGAGYGAKHPALIRPLRILARTYAATGNDAAALEELARAVEIEDAALGEIFSLGSERQRMTYLARAHELLAEVLSLVTRTYIESAGAKELAMACVLKRKCIGAEAFAVQREAVLSGKYPELAAPLRKLGMLRSQIATRLLAGPGPGKAEAERSLLGELGAEKETVEAELARAIPEMRLEHRFNDCSPDLLSRSLPSDSVLVEIVRTAVIDFSQIAGENGAQPPERYLAFILHPGGAGREISITDLGDASRIEELVREHHEILARHHDAERTLKDRQADLAQSRQTGSLLREAVFDPLMTAFGACKRVIIAPDGELSRLPYETLPSGRDKFLLDDYSFIYLATGRDAIVRMATEQANYSPPIVLADPDFDLPADGGAQAPTSPRLDPPLVRAGMVGPYFTRLPGTRKEGEKIASMLAVIPVLGSAVLDASVKAYQSPLILHIATHGFFLPDPQQRLRPLAGPEQAAGMYGSANPLLRSGLALAGANRWLSNQPAPPEAEDGILSAEDVLALDLAGTRLVVLSACETGLGEIRIGEGVLGLRRAFVLAGADMLIMSLWKVPDDQAQELMTRMYSYLLEGLSPPAALRSAQLSLRKEAPHPADWGAFICQGLPEKSDWRLLPA